jgi:hypothetical protein
MRWRLRLARGWGDGGPSDKHKAGSQARLSVVAVRDVATLKNFGAFRGMFHTRTGETPYIQRCHFGATFALVARTTMQTASRVERLMDLTAATRLFSCARFLHLQ